MAFSFRVWSKLTILIGKEQLKVAFNPFNGSSVSLRQDPGEVLWVLALEGILVTICLHPLMLQANKTMSEQEEQTKIVAGGSCRDSPGFLFLVQSNVSALVYVSGLPLWKYFISQVSLLASYFNRFEAWLPEAWFGSALLTLMSLVWLLWSAEGKWRLYCPWFWNGQS